MTEATAAAVAPGAGSPLARFERVDKLFANGTLALDRLNLEVRRGEFLSLLGPSGCGKSTALRLLAGLGQPSGGRIAWEGGKPPEISFVFQEPTLMPWATVFKNVWLPLRLKGVSKAQARERIEEALELVGLADFARAYPRELSGGMRMRVSIARALVTHPTLLLMDEPFAALDEITRFKLNDDLLAIQAKQGWTVVFVTHSVFESVYLSTRILVMAPRPGRVFSEIEVPVPLPRSEEFRVSPLFSTIARDTSDALHAAMLSGARGAAA